MTAKGWPSSTGSKRPGTRPARGSARGDRRVVDAQLAGDDDRAQRVADVEAPGQRGPQLEPVDARSASRSASAARIARRAACASGASRPMRIASGKLAGQARAVGVVDVDHAPARGPASNSRRLARK